MHDHLDHHHAEHDRGGRGGRHRARRGAVPLAIFMLLDERPMHGYEIILALSDRFGGTYTPSAGTIYPRLPKLEEDGEAMRRTPFRRTEQQYPPEAEALDAAQQALIPSEA